MAGQIRVDEITDEAGTGAPSFPNQITPASLGTGTPSSSNFLRGDGAWSGVTNATNLTGTSTSNIQTAALASGTADSTTFLRGDRTWQVVSTSPTTAQVLTATAGASVGAVGTYAFLRPNNATTYSAGSTLAGSNMFYNGGLTSAGGNSMSDGASPAGTWRCMGHRSAFNQYGVVTFAATLWLRIS
jgi:hypothetical protein